MVKDPGWPRTSPGTPSHLCSARAKATSTSPRTTRRIPEGINEYVDLHAVWADGGRHVVVGEYLGPASSMVLGYIREKLPDGTWQMGPGNPDFGEFSFNTSIVGADLEHVWVGGAQSCGYRGQILHWDGATWARESLEIPVDPSGQPAYEWPTVTSLVRAPSGDLFAAEGDRVLHSTGDGRWQIVLFARGAANAVWAADAADWYVVGDAIEHVRGGQATLELDLTGALER
jgi:hypothetical protein